MFFLSLHPENEKSPRDRWSPLTRLLQRGLLPFLAGLLLSSFAGQSLFIKLSNFIKELPLGPAPRHTADRTPAAERSASPSPNSSLGHSRIDLPALKTSGSRKRSACDHFSRTVCAKQGSTLDRTGWVRPDREGEALVEEVFENVRR